MFFEIIIKMLNIRKDIWLLQMSLKKIFDSYFKYQPQNHYKFSLPDNSSLKVTNKDNNTSNETQKNKIEKIFPSLKVNLEYMKTKYNVLINSDIIIKQFTINARGKQYDAFIAFIDGLADSEFMDNFILKPLMMRNKNNLFDNSQNKVIAEAVSNNITVRKVKKFDLSNYMMGCLIPQNNVKRVSTFAEVSNRNQ